jgi:CubicO group peptidase (beta-lactamase class C family)
MGRSIFCIYFLTLIISCAGTVDSQVDKYHWPSEQWEYVDNLEKKGWSKESLLEVKELTETFDTAAMVIVSDGKIISEWGNVHKKYQVHSIRKSLLNSIIGIEVERSHIDIHQSLGDAGIDDSLVLSKQEKTATIEDLLKARSCVFHPTFRLTIPARDSCKPGDRFYYNSWDFNTLGRIFNIKSNIDMFKFFSDEIAAPLQMENFKISDGKYFKQKFSNSPAYKFRMSARDMARFGVLFSRQGQWRNKQIISKEWIEQSLVTYTPMGELGGYGYMWWVEDSGKLVPGLMVPKGAFIARGLRGHFIYVDPSKDLVVVHRVDTDSDRGRVNIEQFGQILSGINKSIIL